MAKQKVNKSQLIRDALKDHPGKTPLELTEVLKAKGLNVSAQYISTIKSNTNKKKKGRGKRRGAKAAAARQVGSNSLYAAVELVKVAGGLEAARQALGTVAQIARFGAENG